MLICRFCLFCLVFKVLFCFGFGLCFVFWFCFGFGFGFCFVFEFFVSVVLYKPYVHRFPIQTRVSVWMKWLGT